MKARSAGCRAWISSTVNRIGVSEFLTSWAVLRASVCQLAIEDALALKLREELGVGDAVRDVVRIEHHGGRHDRTGQRSAPRFVHTTDQTDCVVVHDLHCDGQRAIDQGRHRFRRTLGRAAFH